MTTADRFSMPLGETMFSLRAIRRLKPDPIPDADIRDILEAAIRAPTFHRIKW
jgi:nitroreductase